MKIGITGFVPMLFLMLSCATHSAAKGDKDLLKLDDHAPAFEVSDVRGNPVSLQKSIENGPLVLVFLRGFG